MIDHAVLEPGRIDLDRNLGTDPYQTQERSVGENYQNPIAEDEVNLEKLVLRCRTSSHRCIPIMTKRKALQTRILKMENCEKNAGFTAVHAGARGS